MARVIEKSAKTVDDALKAALEELGVKEVDVNYEIIEEASRGFLGIIGTKPAKIRVIVKENEEKIEPTPLIDDTNDSPQKEEIEQEEHDVKKVVDKVPEEADTHDEKKIVMARKFLQDIFDNMNLEVNIETIPSEDIYTFNISGQNLGILIGKHGQTLDALQYLVNLAANRNERQRMRFIVDVENYRNRRAETLQNLAKNLADRAIKMDQEVKLEPMNRHERRVIHASLQDNDKVTTYSKGEEPHRYIVISPKRY